MCGEPFFAFRSACYKDSTIWRETISQQSTSCGRKSSQCHIHPCPMQASSRLSCQTHQTHTAQAQPLTNTGMAQLSCATVSAVALVGARRLPLSTRRQSVVRCTALLPTGGQLLAHQAWGMCGRHHITKADQVRMNVSLHHCERAITCYKRMGSHRSKLAWDLPPWEGPWLLWRTALPGSGC